ncbi:lysozyme inhibitor [Marinomonas sp. M1K-6]|uniref:Lysozyme inhibitor n=1 Tax=Marinomonas profundi TaxID=2726122 RepID=A0A847R0A9_9GAMM|nr:MliC family protein [Marinomonas profundi]NLQ16842.1 lysozyme inhibitor [Marinomonas profundi]UDV02573.1 MliC family protein [Marinomonas profundi]
MKINKLCLQAVVVGVSLFGLMACSTLDDTLAINEKEYQVEEVIQTNSALYRCDGKPLAILFHAEQAQARWQEKSYQLTHAVSASGAFYLGEGLSFWIKGNEAELELHNMKKFLCHLVRVES